jgi:AraC-like DNA-binding protein
MVGPVALHVELFLPPRSDAAPSVLDELGYVLLDCLRLKPVNKEAQTHVLEAIRQCAMATGWVANSAQPAASCLMTWQERVALSMLSEDNTTSLAIAEVAGACGMSPTQFARAFKAKFGVPPQRWRLLRRVEHAKKLMLETDLTLTDIACECGFSEQSHFTHTFVKFVGKSPREWRHEFDRVLSHKPSKSCHEPFRFYHSPADR